MTVTTVAINCDVSLADDTEFTAARLDFTLSGPDFDSASNDTIPAHTVSVTLDVDGLGTANLWPVDLGINNTHYIVTVVGSFVQSGATKSAVFVLGNIRPPSAGAPFPLADLLAQESGGIIVGSTVYATLAAAVDAAVSAGTAAVNAATAAGADIYPDTAAGIAAVADGAVFMVPVVGGGLSIYQRDGVSAVLIGSFGETPELATTTVAGLMSAPDKVKLDAVNLTTISGALQSANNLSDVASAPAALANLGVTATTAELNILDGVTATATQLNSTVAGNFLAGGLAVGEVGAQRGTVDLFGSPTGSSGGGVLNIYTADDNDDVLDSFQISAVTNDLRIRANGSAINLLYFDGGLDSWDFYKPANFQAGVTGLEALQATWNTGTDTTESTITPAKLAGAIAAQAVSGSLTLLGTLTTTSGSSQTLSSLDLTGYKFLRCVLDDVSGTTTGILRLGGIDVTLTAGSGSTRFSGILDIDLVQEIFAANLCATTFVNSSTSSNPFAGRMPYNTATTSISFSLSSGTFDEGSIRVYGVV